MSSPGSSAMGPELSLASVPLDAVLESLAVGVVVVDGAGRVVSANAAARDLLEGGPAQAMTGGRVVTLLREAMRSGQQREEVVEHHGPPRRSIRLRAVRAGGGAVVQLDDLTEARRVDQVRRDFVSNISHELKTPVGALALLAETLVGETDVETAARLAERVRDEAGRLGRIVQDLLDLSRLESEAEPERDPVTLDDALTEAVTRVRAAAEHKGLAIETATPTGGQVLGDRRQLVSALFNLLENAVTYSDPGSVVTAGVIVTEDGGRDVWVADEGIGIPPEEQARIFQRFYRVDRARSRATGGTGLGLAIVRHVAQNHGATVAVESTVGHGSRFVLTFPPGVVERFIDRSP